MTPDPTELAALAAHLARRRDALLKAWRDAVTTDPRLTSGLSLPRVQLHDHIPALLEDFERCLVLSGDAAHARAQVAQKADAAAHGLHRWQQGFILEEVTRELGRLNECVIAELDTVPAALPSLDEPTLVWARQLWAELFSVTITSSTSRYFRLQQLEAQGHVADLEAALTSVRELENRHAQLWQQAAHDLRGNLGVVTTATAGLSASKASEEARNSFIRLLDRNVRALHRLLEDVTSLARLQGGQESRALATFDASLALSELCERLEPLAQERGLVLLCEGTPGCVVEGDEVKTIRIAQNLVLNAIKYTRQGAVSVDWGYEEADTPDRWFFRVVDTGPGFQAGPGARMVEALAVATDQAKELEADAATGDISHVTSPALPSRATADSRPAYQAPGEGIGLSIVKRLCELLDATIDLDSTPDVGTTVRVHLPRRYGGVIR